MCIHSVWMESSVLVRVCVVTPPLLDALKHFILFFFFFLEKVTLPPQPPDSSFLRKVPIYSGGDLWPTRSSLRSVGRTLRMSVCVSKFRPCCLSGGVLTGGLSPGGDVFFLQHRVGLLSQNWNGRPNAPLPSHPLLCWWVRQHVMLNEAFTFSDAWVTPTRWWELCCDLRNFFFKFQVGSSQSLMMFLLP